MRSYVDAAYPWLDAPLEQALGSQRGHALLVHGPLGVGQFEFCLRLAQAWLCEQPGCAPGASACGACPSCHLVSAHAHPDLMVIVPEALLESLGWAPDDDAPKDSDSRSKGKPSAEIKVDAIRRAVAFAQQTSARGVAKVVVVYPAERMNAVAANTLLKTLEEPPGAARFVLGAGQAERLLPTIRSRCQSVRLTLPDPAAAQDWLAEQGVSQPAIALAASGGEPLTAVELARQGVDAARWVSLPGVILGGQTASLTNWPLPLLVDTLQKLCLDLTLQALGQAPQYFPPACLPRGAPLLRLIAWAGALRKFKRHAEHPANAALQIESLLMQAQQAISGAVLPPA